MKNKTLNDTIEEIARMHLGVGDLSVTDIRNLSIYSIRTALSEAVKAGEKIGYNEGYNNAKLGCEQETCECSITFD